MAGCWGEGEACLHQALKGWRCHLPKWSRLGTRQVRERTGFTFRYVTFEVPVGYPSDNDEKTNGYSSVKLKGAIRARDLKFSQFSSVAQSCPTLCNPMNHRTPGLPVHRQLPEFTQTHVHQVSDALQPSHPLSSPSPTAPNPSQHQCLFQ